MSFNTKKIVPIIMAGGSGTRLWPYSRSSFPKQFQSLRGENSLFQETILRLKGLAIEELFFVALHLLARHPYCLSLTHLMHL